MDTIVNIYLPTTDSPVQWIVALSIPCSDIERLSLRPLKWLRFVTFAVCGARGHLYATQDGGDLDYDNISFADLVNTYYYHPDGDYHIIDHHALDDRVTSSADTSRRSAFRRDVISRDGDYCVITTEEAEMCDAAHIIPRSKGDEYIDFVIHDRNDLYEEHQENLTINSVENGLLLTADLHGTFRRGKIAFLKTPNFALNPADIPRVEIDAMPSNRTTLQNLEPPTRLYFVLGRDARMTGTGLRSPSSLLLDYMYGVAACKCWIGAGIRDMLEARFQRDYKDIPIPTPSPLTSDSDDEDELSDPTNDDYPPRGGGRRRERRHRSEMSDEMLRAMDTMRYLSMFLKGTTPQALAAARQRQEEEAELRAQETSRTKVEQWLEESHSDRSGEHV